MREVVIVSRKESRHGEQAFKRLIEELPNRGVTIAQSHIVEKRRNLRATIRQAVKAKAECVVVAGGDGAQAAAASELVESETALAVVPAGTGNTLAFELGVSKMEDAIETIVSGRAIQIDLGEVNGEIFVNFATVGLFAEVAGSTPHWLKRIVGPIAYALSGAPFLAKPPFRLRVEWGNKSLEILTHQAIVASGRYFGYQPLTSEANMRSGKLAFFSAAGSSQAEILRTNAALLLGQQEELPEAHCFTAKKITITTKPRQALNIDGHAIGKTPAKFRVLPCALRVLVPAGYKREA